jgi:hypothetical protein
MGGDGAGREYGRRTAEKGGLCRRFAGGRGLEGNAASRHRDTPCKGPAFQSTSLPVVSHFRPYSKESYTAEPSSAHSLFHPLARTVSDAIVPTSITTTDSAGSTIISTGSATVPASRVSGGSTSYKTVTITDSSGNAQESVVGTVDPSRGKGGASEYRSGEVRTGES